MSVFISPIEIQVLNADVLCAMLLLAVLSIKIITIKQDSGMLHALNKSLSLGLYPLVVIFSLLIVEWTLL
ncbi:MAG: hypothetical protein AAF846_14330 [Chloroflexota bacterium]